MAGIQMSGLASGLDTQSLIAQLMDVERIPRYRIERQQAAAQARQDALRDIATKLKALKGAASDLQAASLWTPTRAATSNDQSRVVARATGGAVAAGAYDINVTQLATTASQNWTTRTRPILTQLTITDSANAQTLVDIPANSTVDQIVSAINAKAGVPVTASNDNGQLKLVANASGAPGSFTVSGLALNSQVSSVAGVNAAFTVNGVAKSSTTNTDSTSISGVELQLKALTAAGTPVRVDVTETPVAKADVVSKLKAFADAYNAVVDTIRGKLTDKPVANASTVTDAKRGVLYGDSGLTQVLNTLRRGLMDPIAGNPALQDEMHEIGLSTGTAVSTIDPSKVQGKLTFDEAKFTKAWDADRAGVEKLLRGDGVTGGFAQRIDGLLKPMIDVGASFDGRINAVGSQLKSLADSLGRMDKRLERKQDFYRRQFTALETALHKAQTAQQEMQGQLAGLFGSNDK